MFYRLEMELYSEGCAPCPPAIECLFKPLLGSVGSLMKEHHSANPLILQQRPPTPLAKKNG